MTMSTPDGPRPDLVPAEPPPAAPGQPTVVPDESPGWMVVAPPVFPGDEPGQRPRPAREIVVGLLVAVLVAGLGFPLGALWSAIAPHTPAVMTSDGAFLADPEAEHRIADEGWYLIVAISTGLLLAILAWVVLRRYRGIAVLTGLALGGVLAGWLMWWTGHSIGLARARELTTSAPVGTQFTLPVNLRVMNVGLWHGFLPYAVGDVLAIAITAVLVYLLLVGFSGYPGLIPPKDRPAPEDPAAYPSWSGAPGPVPWPAAHGPGD